MRHEFHELPRKEGQGKTDGLFDAMCARFKSERAEAVAMILKGMKPEGGSADRAMWKRVVEMAFNGGIAATHDRLHQIAAIIEGIDRRRLAVDGPVGNTQAEMTEEELRRIYELAAEGTR